MMVPSRLLLMMASSEDSTIASSSGFEEIKCAGGSATLGVAAMGVEAGPVGKELLEDSLKKDPQRKVRKTLSIAYARNEYP
jgi:hypothetical protein